MGQETKIEWCHATFNCWRGCTRISDGCKFCYAETLSHRNPAVLGSWGPNGTRVVAAESAWREPLKWDRRAEEAVYDYTLKERQAGKHLESRPRVFCASLADIFEDWSGPMVDSWGYRLWVAANGQWIAGIQFDIGAPSEFNRPPNPECRPLTMADVRARLFRLIDATPFLDWLLVTKRPENLGRMWPANPNVAIDEEGIPYHVHVEGRDCEGMEGDCCWGSGWLPKQPHPLPSPAWRPNVWLGVSCEDQARADERIPELLKVPAAVRFLSVEPLLGSINLRGHILGSAAGNPAQCECGHGHGFTRCPNTGSVSSTCYMPGCDCPGFRRRRGDGIHWVIVGSESGPHARPMDEDWVRSIRDQCQAAGVPFFYKQKLVNGKKVGLPELDGRPWAEFPEISQIQGV